jgi:hypothetical protein
MRTQFTCLILVLMAMAINCLTEASVAQQANNGPIGGPALCKHTANGELCIQPDANMEDKAPSGIAFHYWKGFAEKEDESYILRVSIEGVRPVGPMNIRRLLASNKTLEEMRKEILGEEENVMYRGHLKLGEAIYRLRNVEMKFEDDNLTLTSDLVVPSSNSAKDNSAEIAGNIEVRTASYEDGPKGQGRLIITKGPLIGTYRVLLDMLH